MDWIWFRIDETISSPRNNTTFNDLDLPLIRISRSRHFSTLNISETSAAPNWQFQWGSKHGVGKVCDLDRNRRLLVLERPIWLLWNV